MYKVQIDTDWLFSDGGVNSQFKSSLKNAVLRSWSNANIKSETFDTFVIETDNHSSAELSELISSLSKEILPEENVYQRIKIIDLDKQIPYSTDEILYEQIAGYASAQYKIILDEEQSTKISSTTSSKEVGTETQEVPTDQASESGLQQLKELIGLSTIKRDVVELVNFVQIQKRRQSMGKKTLPISLHMVFTGNPGTGKTSVARIIAKIYNEIGVLPTQKLVEVDRAQLVAGYVGQTALKTQKKIDEAKGGILFIDEAYTLAKSDGNDFGQEAIDTLLKAMEDMRDNLVVIVAGYTERMSEFINSNPGLKSRFNRYIDFPDYSPQELLLIFQKFCTDNDYEIDPVALRYVEDKIRIMVAEKKENFANARAIRNLFEYIIMKQASRVAASNDLNERELSRICIEDI